MSENHYTNIFNVTGDGNTVNFEQHNGNDGNETLALVLKFLVTILLSPVLIPMILAMNGYRLMQGNSNLLEGYTDGDE